MFFWGEAFPIESSISILFTQIFAYHFQRNGVATGEQHESEFGKHSAGSLLTSPNVLGYSSKNLKQQASLHIHLACEPSATAGQTSGEFLVRKHLGKSTIP